MKHTRNRYLAEFDYPGALFPESITKTAKGPSIEDALAVAPSETEGTYFVKDRWYAVTITEVIEKQYLAADGSDEEWVEQRRSRVGRWVVGEKVHVDDIPDDDRHEILRSNIRNNSEDGFGVKTRAGNWQIASDYDGVLSLAEAGA